jgi:dynein heavy chain, axonemal
MTTSMFDRHRLDNDDARFNRSMPSLMFRDLYLAYVNQLPLYNSPNILGLHDNVETNYLSSLVDDICLSMYNMQPIEHDIDEYVKRERTHRQDIHEQSNMLRILEFVRNLIDRIRQKIPSTIDLELIHEQVRSRSYPLLHVLYQELQRYNCLLSRIWTTLDELQRTLHGENNLSISFDEIQRDLYYGRIPTIWKEYAPQTKKSLGNWIDHLCQCHQQYQRWIADGK